MKLIRRAVVWIGIASDNSSDVKQARLSCGHFVYSSSYKRLGSTTVCETCSARKRKLK